MGIGILVLFLILEESFQLLTIEYDFSFGFAICGPHLDEVGSRYTHTVDSFIS